KARKPARTGRALCRVKRSKRKPPWQAVEEEWRRPIFPPSCPGSIVSAEAFHFRVRDGNGWDHLALATEEKYQQHRIYAQAPAREISRAFAREGHQMQCAFNARVAPVVNGRD